MKEKPERHKSLESERRLRHNFRLARLLQFLELVSGRGRWNVRSLMKELEVSERTIHRLRETLELAGVPIYFDKSDDSYRLRSSFRFPSLYVTDEGAFSSATASALESSDAFHVGGKSKALVRKLAENSDQRLSSIFDDVRRLTQVADLKIADGPRHRDFIQTIQRALAARRTIVVVYRSP